MTRTTTLALAIAVTALTVRGTYAEDQAAPPARPCQDAGSDRGLVEGRLRLLEGIGPAAFIIALPSGLCLTGSADAVGIGKVTTVQLYAPTADGMQRLYGLVGQRVVARGKLSAGANFQQKAPVLMEVNEIAAR